MFIYVVSVIQSTWITRNRKVPTFHTDYRWRIAEVWRWRKALRLKEKGKMLYIENIQAFVTRIKFHFIKGSVYLRKYEVCFLVWKKFRSWKTQIREWKTGICVPNSLWREEKHWKIDCEIRCITVLGIQKLILPQLSPRGSKWKAKHCALFAVTRQSPQLCLVDIRWTPFKGHLVSSRSISENNGTLFYARSDFENAERDFRVLKQKVVKCNKIRSLAEWINKIQEPLLTNEFRGICHRNDMKWHFAGGELHIPNVAPILANHYLLLYT